MGMGQNTSASGGSNNLQAILSQYTTPMPDIVNQYMTNLGSQGLLNFPSFNTLFKSYQDVSNQAVGVQAAGLNETFGSQGARYSSDLLGAQSNLRRNVSLDQANTAGQYQRGLRQDQFNEASGIASMQYGASEAGMARLFSDFLRRTSPPPGQQAVYGLTQGYGLPATVVG